MEPGTELAGRYVLEELLGSGAMGLVWRALDRELERHVAVKMLRQAADAQDMLRFRREARIGASLKHPGITVVHDVGRHDGQLFIVMELLQGSDLQTLLAYEPSGLAVSAVVAIAAQAASALAVAHANHVVHRDLKPANLFVLADDNVKICDFGIAWLADDTGRLTTSGHTLGTPAYMAPEQWSGKDADALSDLYSLGCILHEMLTGQPPFPAMDWPTLMRNHLATPPASPRQVRADVPADLDRLVLDLLAKNPADRPQDAGAVAAMLRAMQDFLPRSPAEPAERLSQDDRGPATEPARIDAAGHRAEGKPTRPARTAQASNPYLASASDLLSEAEQIALNSSGTLKGTRLADVACRFAAFDVKRATQAWLKIPNENFNSNLVRANVALAKAYASINPKRAEQIAANLCFPLDDQWPYLREREQAEALASIAGVYAITDPADAERMVRMIPDSERKIEALAAVARAYVGLDESRARLLAEQAEEVARNSGVSGRWACRFLARAATAWAQIDRDRSQRLLVEAENMTSGLHDWGSDSSRVSALIDVARGFASIDLSHAEDLARTISGDAIHARLLTDLAEMSAPEDPHRAKRLIAEAEQLARTNERDYFRALELAYVARGCAQVDETCAMLLILEAEELALTVPNSAQLFDILLAAADALIRLAAK